MTLGQKIRKYRLLKGLTQKELGKKALHSAGSDIRINQYEKDFTAPKADKRAALARELDVDIEALSDSGYVTDEDILYILFALEEEKGLRIRKENGKIHLIFDDSQDPQLITYLNYWYDEAVKERTQTEERMEYERWKARFSSNINMHFSEKQAAIDKKYNERVDEIVRGKKYAIEATEVIGLLRQIADSGVFVSANREINAPSGISFSVREMLNPPSELVAELYAGFIAEIVHYIELGANCYSEMSLPEDYLIITYYIPSPSLNVIHDEILFYTNDLKNGVREESREDGFERRISDIHVNIEEAIKFDVGEGDGDGED